MKTIVIALLFCGCGDNALSTDGGGADLSAPDLAALPDLTVGGDQACADFAAALCARLATCTAVLELWYGDMATCVARSALNCTLHLNLPGAPPTVGPLEACGTALGTATCDDLLTGNSPAACRVMGMETDGLACADDSQCKSGRCVRGPLSECGACGVPPGAGASCASGACAPGLACGANAKVCVAYAMAGANCDPDHPCLPSLACQGANMMGKCVAPLAQDAPCDPAAKDYAGCDAAHGGYCNGFTKTCKSYGFAKSGEPCGLVNGGATLCAGSGFCMPNDAGAFMGNCVAAAADGTACDGKLGPNCVPPAGCVSGFCRLPSPGSCK